MKNIVFGFLFLFSFIKVFATHNRAGEITYKHISGYTYEVTITTYTYTPSPANRDELDILWGDGTTNTLPLANRINLENEVSYSTYKGIHTYIAPAEYTISCYDPNRNAGVINIPNSVNVPFYVESKLVISPFLFNNNSPILYNPPLDNACIYQPYVHNPGAFDPDGDSLSYKIVKCKGEDGLDIPGYSFPASSSFFKINEFTGDLTWENPVKLGEYNIAILIEEWRKGIKVGSIVRDMQILVGNCNNTPPKISAVIDTCVIAGSQLKINLLATDIKSANNVSNYIKFTALGNPFQITNSPATFNAYNGFDTARATISWNTNCAHIKKNAYTFYIKATDNGNPVVLSDIHTLNVKVICPAIDSLKALASANNILLNWKMVKCTNANGYRIYRKQIQNSFTPSDCQTGIPDGYGYQMIKQINDINTLNYTDDNNGNGLVPGISYCYRIIAYFQDGSESIASNEACATLNKDIPIISGVDILKTDNTKGKIKISWLKPTELDTIQYGNPYKYYIFRGNDLSGNNIQLIDSLSGMDNVVYIDSLLNTRSQSYHYRVDLYSLKPGATVKIGSTENASSVFLSVAPTNQKVFLSWNEVTPWINLKYVIYKYNSTSSQFDSIYSTIDRTFIDSNLINGKEYCYKIKSIGEYSALTKKLLLSNFSQELCAIPIDNIPPCIPQITVEPNCSLMQNEIKWAISIDCFNDAEKFNIYYAPTNNVNQLALVNSINNNGNLSYIHNNISTIAGCYVITTLDSLNNESAKTNMICIDIDACPLYSLPNVFTPDGDGINDLLNPFPYSFVQKIDLNIYNRWGQLVFKTDNPDINWDGKDKTSNQLCSDGVYFYTCDVYEYKLDGVSKRSLNGVVYILSGKQ